MTDIIYDNDDNDCFTEWQKIKKIETNVLTSWYALSRRFHGKKLWDYSEHSRYEGSHVYVISYLVQTKIITHRRIKHNALDTCNFSSFFFQFQNIWYVSKRNSWSALCNQPLDIALWTHLVDTALQSVGEKIKDFIQKWQLTIVAATYHLRLKTVVESI